MKKEFTTWHRVRQFGGKYVITPTEARITNHGGMLQTKDGSTWLLDGSRHYFKTHREAVKHIENTLTAEIENLHTQAANTQEELAAVRAHYGSAEAQTCKTHEPIPLNMRITNAHKNMYIQINKEFEVFTLLWGYLPKSDCIRQNWTNELFPISKERVDAFGYVFAVLATIDLKIKEWSEMDHTPPHVLVLKRLRDFVTALSRKRADAAMQELRSEFLGESAETCKPCDAHTGWKYTTEICTNIDELRKDADAWQPIMRHDVPAYMTTWGAIADAYKQAQSEDTQQDFEDAIQAAKDDPNITHVAINRPRRHGGMHTGTWVKGDENAEPQHVWRVGDLALCSGESGSEIIKIETPKHGGVAAKTIGERIAGSVIWSNIEEYDRQVYWRKQNCTPLRTNATRENAVAGARAVFLGNPGKGVVIDLSKEDKAGFINAIFPDGQQYYIRPQDAYILPAQPPHENAKTRKNTKS